MKPELFHESLFDNMADEIDEGVPDCEMTIGDCAMVVDGDDMVVLLDVV